MWSVKRVRVWILTHIGGFKGIGHFRVPLCLFFKASLSEKPFLWKRLWFAWEWNCMQNSFRWKVSHVDSFWNRGTRDSEMAYCFSNTVKMALCRGYCAFAKVCFVLDGCHSTARSMTSKVDTWATLDRRYVMFTCTQNMWPPKSEPIVIKGSLTA